MSSIKIVTVLFISLILFCSCNHNTKESSNTQTDSTQVMYFDGDILTMEGEVPTYVDALVQEKGKIVFTGSKNDATEKFANAVQVNLQGKTLLPGLLDAHSHYFNSLLVANQCKLYAPPSGPAKDVESIIAALKAFAAERKIAKGEMIMGYGYDDNVMPNTRLLNRDDLDAAFPDNPVRIDHVSMHGCVLNSLAMKQYGYDANYKTPPGGICVRKPGTNEPYGLIMETAHSSQSLRFRDSYVCFYNR